VAWLLFPDNGKCLNVPALLVRVWSDVDLATWTMPSSSSSSMWRILLLLIGVVFCSTTQAADDDGEFQLPKSFGKNNNNMFGTENQVCPTYSCPTPFVPVNKWPLGITSTGCESGGGMGNMMIMKGGKKYKHIEHCCHLKNACYQLCGSNKQTCDAELDKCMEKGCDTLSDYSTAELESMSDDEINKEKDDCRSTKGIVALLGNISGCKEYDMHQRIVCECVDKDKVGDKMERVLRNFYKKYNPDGSSKVKGLLDKTAGKRSIFNKILYGLVKKYPDAIKKKELEMP
jgi:hypothetical protein